MADLNSRIKPKKSSTTGEVPQAADLEVAEIAVNTADGKLFVKHTDNSIKEISGAGGGGGVGSLDDLSDVSYLGGSLEISGLDEIKYSSSDVPSGASYKTFANPSYGMGVWAATTGGSSTLYLHESKGALLRPDTTDQRVWISGALESTDNSPELRITSGDPFKGTPSGFSVGFTIDETLAQDTTYTLPLSDGSDGQVLSTNGSGVLSWVASSGDPLPSVNGWTIDSDATASVSQVLDAPTHISGDLLIACIMSRNSGGALTPPSGFTLYGEYLSSITFTGDFQTISVFTKTATASEPATYTWTQASSGRICGFITAVEAGAAITSVTESYGNATTATITTLLGRLNITAATWIYSSSAEPAEVYSQSGPGMVEITDSPVVNARISGGYTTEAGTVTSTHDAGNVDNNPNHGMINIALEFPSSISDSDDVDTVTTPPTDGQVLTWVNANSQWEPAALQGAAVRTALGIGEYVDDAAAGAGSVASGAMYYNTTSSDYRLKT